jgi:hypothetical protein
MVKGLVHLLRGPRIPLKCDSSPLMSVGSGMPLLLHFTLGDSKVLYSFEHRSYRPLRRLRTKGVTRAT